MTDKQKLQEELDELNAEAARIQEGTPSTDLVTTSNSPEQIKKDMALQAAAATKVAEKIQEKSKELQKAMREEVRSMEEKMHAEMERVKAGLEPMERMAEAMQEGIWTVNLYLGSDEKMVLIRDGEPAPADSVIHVRQLVLAMDQECAVAAEDGGITAMEADEFDAWLLQDPAHIDQVIPEEKGIVALVPKKYEEDWEGRRRKASEENAKTYFLIRNGEMLLRVYTDFEVGDRLIPSSTEFTDYFKVKKSSLNVTDQDYETLKPGSRGWDEAADKADERKRHFMRVALILQGLVDRTTVLRPLPPQGINFLDPRAHEKEHVRFIMDAENLLTDGRNYPPFRDWQKERNAQLAPGFRIIGAFSSFKFEKDTHKVEQKGERGYTRVEHSRINPSWGEYPPSGVPLAVTSEVEKGKRFRCAFDPSEGSYREKRCSVEIRISDRYVLPFDLATIEDMEYYLHSRINREAYIDMFPVLKAAIYAKERELEEEAPFRELLIGKMAEITSLEQAEQDVDELIQWQKTKSRNHESILADDEKSLKQILREYKKRQESAAKAPDAALIKELVRAHLGAICIHRNSSGRYVVVERMDYKDDLSPYVREVEYNRLGDRRDVHENRIIGIRWKKWEIVWKDDKLWDAYNFRASRSDSLSGEDIEEAIRVIREEWERFERSDRSRKEKLIAIEFDPTPRENGFIVWATDRNYRNELRVTYAHTEWKRNRDGSFNLHTYSGNEFNMRSQIFPWTPEDKKPTEIQEAKFGVVRPEKEKYPLRLVWVIDNPEEVIADVVADYEAKKKAAEEESALRGKAEAYARTIEDAWVKRKEDEEKAKFMRDYGDESLWEGHRKLVAERFEFPYNITGHDRNYSQEDDDYDPEESVQSLCRDAIEQGIILPGRTVAEIVKETKWDKVPHKKRFGDDRDPIPEDLMDLEFSKIESEELDEDEVADIMEED